MRSVLRAASLSSWALLACSSSGDASPDDAAPDAGGDLGGDGGDGGTDAGAPGFCTSETPVVVAGGAGVTATTAHYELYAEASEAEAIDLARLLEASRAAFASWFERSPPPARMKVKVYKDQPAWAAALAADGLPVPAEAGGYFSPKTKTAYLFRQGNPYYSHVLAVHEATHQYHELTRLAPGTTMPFWYVEGHAEYLSRHDWDGQCVRLGVTSLLSWEDLPAKAKSVDVGAIVDGTAVATRAESWAIFRFLDTGTYRASFKAYRDAFDANKAPSFAALVAPPASLTAPLAAFLPSAQEPMKPIYTEWVHIGPTSVAVDTPVVFSFALVKAWPLAHLEAKLRVPTSGKWTAGVIVSYTDDKHYTGVVHGADGKVSTFTAAGSATWATLGTAPAPSGGVEVMSVDFAGDKATVHFDGASFPLTVTAPRAGLAASDTTARFVDVGWTP